MNGWAPAPTERAPGWLASYADLMSLLAAFFVLLYAMSAIEVARWRKVSPAFGISLNPDDRAAAPRTGAEQATQGPNLLGQAKSSGADLDYVALVVSRRIEADPALHQLGVERHSDRLSIEVPVALLFRSEAGRLTQAGAALVTSLGAAIAGLPNELSVTARIGEGAAGPVPPRVWALGLERAASTVAVLVRGGVARRPAVLARGSHGAGTVEIAIHSSESRRVR